MAVSFIFLKEASSTGSLEGAATPLLCFGKKQEPTGEALLEKGKYAQLKAIGEYAKGKIEPPSLTGLVVTKAVVWAFIKNAESGKSLSMGLVGSLKAQTVATAAEQWIKQELENPEAINVAALESDEFGVERTTGANCRVIEICLELTTQSAGSHTTVGEAALGAQSIAGHKIATGGSAQRTALEQQITGQSLQGLSIGEVAFTQTVAGHKKSEGVIDQVVALGERSQGYRWPGVGCNHLAGWLYNNGVATRTKAREVRAYLDASWDRWEMPFGYQILQEMVAEEIETVCLFVPAGGEATATKASCKAELETLITEMKRLDVIYLELFDKPYAAGVSALTYAEIFKEAQTLAAGSEIVILPKYWDDYRTAPETAPVGVQGIAYWAEGERGSESLAEARAKALLYAEQFDVTWDRFDTSFMNPTQMEWALSAGFKFITLYKAGVHEGTTVPKMKGGGTVPAKAEGEQKNLTKTEVQNRIKEIAAWIEATGAPKLLEILNEPYETNESNIPPLKHAEIWKWAVEVLLTEYPAITPVAKYWGTFFDTELGASGEWQDAVLGDSYFKEFVKKLKELSGYTTSYLPTNVAVHLYNHEGGTFASTNYLGEGVSAGGSGWHSLTKTEEDIEASLGTNVFDVYITETGEEVPTQVSESTSAAHIKQKVEEVREHSRVKLLIFFAFTGNTFGFFKGTRPPKEERNAMVASLAGTLAQGGTWSRTESGGGWFYDVLKHLEALSVSQPVDVAIEPFNTTTTIEGLETARGYLGGVEPYGFASMERVRETIRAKSLTALHYFITAYGMKALEGNAAAEKEQAEMIEIVYRSCRIACDVQVLLFYALLSGGGLGSEIAGDPAWGLYQEEGGTFGPPKKAAVRLHEVLTEEREASLTTHAAFVQAVTGHKTTTGAQAQSIEVAQATTSPQRFIGTQAQQVLAAGQVTAGHKIMNKAQTVAVTIADTTSGAKTTTGSISQAAAFSEAIQGIAQVGKETVVQAAFQQSTSGFKTIATPKRTVYVGPASASIAGAAKLQGALSAWEAIWGVGKEAPTSGRPTSTGKFIQIPAGEAGSVTGVLESAVFAGVFIRSARLCAYVQMAKGHSVTLDLIGVLSNEVTTGLAGEQWVELPLTAAAIATLTTKIENSETLELEFAKAGAGTVTVDIFELTLQLNLEGASQLVAFADAVAGDKSTTGATSQAVELQDSVRGEKKAGGASAQLVPPLEQEGAGAKKMAVGQHQAIALETAVGVGRRTSGGSQAQKVELQQAALGERTVLMVSQMAFTHVLHGGNSTPVHLLSQLAVVHNLAVLKVVPGAVGMQIKTTADVLIMVYSKDVNGEIVPGSEVEIVCEFTIPAGENEEGEGRELADPTAVSIAILSPAPNSTPEGLMVSRKKKGVYATVVTPETPGLWRVYGRGTGAVVAAGEATFPVSNSPFV